MDTETEQTFSKEDTPKIDRYMRSDNKVHKLATKHVGSTVQTTQ